MTTLDLLITVVAGACIGFSMGTVGGGGAILAVPVLVYQHPNAPTPDCWCSWRAWWAS